MQAWTLRVQGIRIRQQTCHDGSIQGRELGKPIEIRLLERKRFVLLYLGHTNVQWENPVIPQVRQNWHSVHNNKDYSQAERGRTRRRSSRDRQIHVARASPRRSC